MASTLGPDRELGPSYDFVGTGVDVGISVGVEGISVGEAVVAVGSVVLVGTGVSVAIINGA